MNNKEHKSKREEREKMLALYNDSPYPISHSEQIEQGTPLVEHWINSMFGFDSPVLGPSSRILVAGCGSGEEAISLASYYPSAEVVGLDFSPKSIQIAQQKAKDNGLSNVTFEVADLTEMPNAKDRAKYDFILSHGVADYVTDVEAFLSFLSFCLKESGLIYLSVNSPRHPAKRIQEAFKTLGLGNDGFVESKVGRELLSIISKQLGQNTGIRDISKASKSYLDIDIFPPLSNHLSIDGWLHEFKKSGLIFCASLDMLIGLGQLTDAETSNFFQLTRSELSLWMLRLREDAGFHMLVGKEDALHQNFEDIQEVFKSKPKLAKSIGQLPPLSSPPDQAMHLTLQYAGLPNFTIFSNAFDLEVMRQCDGERRINEIIHSIDATGDLEHLRTTLFRAYCYGIISM